MPLVEQRKRRRRPGQCLTAGRLLGLAAICLFSASWPLRAQSPAEGIEHFVRVDARVCTGGQPTREQLAALREQGIHTVVDLREASEHDVSAEAIGAYEVGLRFVHIPVRSDDPKAEQADAFLAATADPEVFPLFLHCGSGNRAGAFWMIRRVLVDGWSEDEAEKEARRIGLRSPNLFEFADEYIKAHRTEK